MKKRKLSWQMQLGLFLVAWFGFAIVGGFADNPLGAISEVVADQGGWEPEELRLKSGGYSYRLFYFNTWGEVALTTVDGEVPIRVEFTHVPLVGSWLGCYSVGVGDGCASGRDFDG